MTWGPSALGGGTFAAERGEVDAPSAVEFMREALVKINEDDIGVVAELLARRRQLLAPVLAADALAAGTADAVRPILARTFATRRRSDALLVSVGAPSQTARPRCVISSRCAKTESAAAPVRRGSRPS